ncbi:MAG: hypothetical protein JSW55_17565 [Chloroflexota bacterium]|nr:MAG: hypothetical protein JSW55_17565 [Chloroflexota bacterium]
MPTDSASYLSTLHAMLDRYFNLEEVRTICFELGVDFDSVAGEGKSARIRELILGLARQDRLPELVSLAASQRPHVSWPAVPPDFRLPSSLQSPHAGQTVQHNYYGDVVTGDKVGGDQIVVGDISGSSGVAIGRGASVSVSTGDTYSGDFRGANVNIKSTLQDVSQTITTLPNAGDSTKAELQSLVAQLNDLLQSAPEASKLQAEEVSEATKLFVDAAGEESPNKTMLRMLGAGLKQAAQTVNEELPAVIDVTGKIVAIVSAIAAL